jgi:hypothetical protein
MHIDEILKVLKLPERKQLVRLPELLRKLQQLTSANRLDVKFIEMRRHL